MQSIISLAWMSLHCFSLLAWHCWLCQKLQRRSSGIVSASDTVQCTRQASWTLHFTEPEIRASALGPLDLGNIKTESYQLAAAANGWGCQNRFLPFSPNTHTHSHTSRFPTSHTVACAIKTSEPLHVCCLLCQGPRGTQHGSRRLFWKGSFG